MLGFDAVATGHHARIGRTSDGRSRLARGADRPRTRATWCTCSTSAQLARTLFPVGEMTKAEVRTLAAALGLRTARQARQPGRVLHHVDGGRAAFLGDRIPLRPGAVVDTARHARSARSRPSSWSRSASAGASACPGGGPKRYVVDVDTAAATVTVGDDADLLRDELVVDGVTWVDEPVDGAVLVQCSAHGEPRRPDGATVARRRRVTVTWAEPQRRVAPGQSVVFYDPTDTVVLGGGIAADRSALRPNRLPTRKLSAHVRWVHISAHISGSGLGSGLDGRPSSGDGEAAALGGGEDGARTARCGEERLQVDGSTVGFIRREREHRRDRFGGRHLDCMTARRPRQIGSLGVGGCQPDVSDLACAQRERVGQHHRIPQHDPGRDEDEPSL